jgi:hypothetical protein
MRMPEYLLPYTRALAAAKSSAKELGEFLHEELTHLWFEAYLQMTPRPTNVVTLTHGSSPPEFTDPLAYGATVRGAIGRPPSSPTEDETSDGHGAVVAEFQASEASISRWEVPSASMRIAGARSARPRQERAKPSSSCRPVGVTFRDPAADGMNHFTAL